jgi:hypothetical protein
MTTCDAPARAAAVVVPAPPCCTTAATRPNSACWLTSPMAMQSGSASMGDRSAQPRDTIARRPSARADSIIARLSASGARQLPKPK